MTEEIPASPPVVKTTPVALLDAPLRHAHVARRMLERSGIVWSVEQVAALEKKIRLVRGMVNEGKIPAAILPTKIGEGKEGQVHYYRILLAGKPHTVAWSQVAKCLISYAGPGELVKGIEVEPAAP